MFGADLMSKAIQQDPSMPQPKESRVVFFTLFSKNIYLTMKE